MIFVVGAERRAWQSAGMSTPAPTDPNALRSLLHERIDQWAAEDLALLHRVMLELERDRLVAELNAEFDRDRESGRLTRLPEIIREARAALALRPPKPA